MTDKQQPDKAVSLDYARRRLGTVWFVATALFFMILIGLSAMGVYRVSVGQEDPIDRTRDLWAWALPTVVPTASLMLTVFAAGALSEDQSQRKVRRFFYQISLGASIFYLALVLLTPTLLSAVSSYGRLELLSVSDFWLAPIQGAVASTLGVLFVTKDSSESTPSEAAPG